MNVKLRVVNDGEHKGKVVLHTSGYGSSLLADGQQVPSTINGWFNASQVEFREFTDEPVRREEVVREVVREVPVETPLSEEESDALQLGLSVLATARAVKRLNDARREMELAVEDTRYLRGNVTENLETMLQAAGLGEVLKELANEMGLYDDEDEEPAGTECPECGEEAFLDPDTGLCVDCEEESDESECRECACMYLTADLQDGLCDECHDELGDDEEEGEDEDDDE